MKLIKNLPSKNTFLAYASYLFRLFPLHFLYKEHLRSWLADPQGRDQYVTYRSEEVEIHWHGKSSQCELADKPVRRILIYVG